MQQQICVQYHVTHGFPSITLQALVSLKGLYYKLYTLLSSLIIAQIAHNRASVIAELIWVVLHSCELSIQ